MYVSVASAILQYAIPPAVNTSVKPYALSIAMHYQGPGRGHVVFSGSTLIIVLFEIITNNYLISDVGDNVGRVYARRLGGGTAANEPSEMLVTISETDPVLTLSRQGQVSSAIYYQSFACVCAHEINFKQLRIHSRSRISSVENINIQYVHMVIWFPIAATRCSRWIRD